MLGEGLRSRRTALVVALLLVLSACGSRLEGQDAAAPGAAVPAGTDDFTVPSGGPGAGTGAAEASAVPGGSTSPDAGPDGIAGSQRSGSSPPSPVGGGTQTTTGGAAALTASAPGVSATEIKIGLVYDEGAGFLNTAFGFAGIGQVDQRRVYDALVADVNARGGILGRKLVPVYATFDSSGPDAQAGTEVLEQRFCNTFRENRVFVTFYGGQETFTRCMNELGIVRVGSANNAVDSQLLAESPLLVVLTVVLDRAAAFTVDRLAEVGFYDEGKNDEPVRKVGLVRYDDPQFARAAAVLKERLRAHGLELAAEAAIREAETVDQIQDEANTLRAAALQFKADGITHVQFLSDGRAFMELMFMQNAEKQLYYPRYGLNSTSGGQALATLLGSDAQSQLSESLQVGWFPIFDVHRSEYSGDKTTAAFQRCIEVLEEAGERFTEGDPTRNKEAIAAAFCDQFNYLVAAAEAAGADLTPQTFMQGGVPRVNGLDSAATYILATTQRRDAVGGTRDGRWLDQCSCFRYANAEIRRV